MLELANKLRSGVLILTMMMLLTACEGAEGNVPEATTASEISSNLLYSDFSYPALSSQEINYLVPNGLIVEDIQTDTNKRYIQYPQFSGLKDKQIEAKLNESVITLIEEMKVSLDPKTIVPYRGIKTLISEEARVENFTIQGYTSFNNNNIVSIQFHGNGEFNSGKPLWVSIVRGLTIDLNTGNRIPLSALFVDGFDYKSVINNSIMKEIGKYQGMGDSEMGSEYELVKPFSGIGENQPYILSEHGILVLFDENSDLFEQSFRTATFMIDYANFDDNLALDRRYYSEDVKLYADETKRRLLSPWRQAGSYENDLVTGEVIGGTFYLSTYSYTSRLDDLFSQMVEKAKTEIKAITFDSKENYIDVNMSKNVIGDYVAIVKYFGIYSSTTGDSKETYLLFDKNDKIVDFPELFVPGFDYDAIIKRIIKAVCEQTPDYDYDKIMAAYDNLAFELDHRGILVKIPYEASHYMNHFRYMIPFHEFGIENLTIFD